MEYLSRIDTKLIYPPFLDILSRLLLGMEQKGVPFYILGDGGYRPFSQQDAMYAQGRGKDRGKRPIITNAKGGYSAHNYAIGADGCADKDVEAKGLQPDWSDPPYKIWAGMAVAHGLEAAYFWNRFPEGPHVQLPLREKGIALHDPKEFPGRPCLRLIHEAEGLPGVWKELDKYTW